jgi:hypothetical protein
MASKDDKLAMKVALLDGFILEKRRVVRLPKPPVTKCKIFMADILVKYEGKKILHECSPECDRIQSYINSLDVIVPLIKKYVTEDNWNSFGDSLYRQRGKKGFSALDLVTFEPKMLAIALLKTVAKPMTY